MKLNCFFIFNWILLFFILFFHTELKPEVGSLSCKHPRLEAVCPRSFQSDVCCCQLPLATLERTTQLTKAIYFLIPQCIFSIVSLCSVGLSPPHLPSRLSSCKHPTLSWNQLQWRLREGCLPGLAQTNTCWTRGHLSTGAFIKNKYGRPVKWSLRYGKHSCGCLLWLLN